jgi:putative phage-type endonuclease
MTPEQRAAWLEARRQGIGSSDAWKCLRQPLEVYLDKLGLLPPKPDNDRMRAGRLLEPVIARMYTEVTGWGLEKPPEILRHPEHHWMLASLDYWAPTDREAIDCKNVADDQRHLWGEPGTDEVPEYILFQMQHQLAVTGFEVGQVAVLFGGWDFQVYTVRRHEVLIDKLIQVEGDLWRRVEAREPPAADLASPDAVELLQALYPPTGPAVELNSDSANWLARYVALGETVRELLKERDEAKANILAAMKDAAEATCEGWKVARKLIKMPGHTVKPHDQERLTIKPPKETARV